MEGVNDATLAFIAGALMVGTKTLLCAIGLNVGIGAKKFSLSA